MKKYLNNFYKYRYLLYEIVRKNIKLQYRNSVLGIFWPFLQPLLTTIVLVAVFSGPFGRSSQTVNYPIYLLCGRLLYEFYSQSTKRAMRSIRNSSSVIKKVYVPKYIYPLSNVISTFVTFLISLLLKESAAHHAVYFSGLCARADTSDALGRCGSYPLHPRGILQGYRVSLRSILYAAVLHDPDIL